MTTQTIEAHPTRRRNHARLAIAAARGRMVARIIPLPAQHGTGGERTPAHLPMPPASENDDLAQATWEDAEWR